MRGTLHTDEYRFVVEKLREARKMAGLLQAQAARRLKRPQSYVSKCEVGERRIDVIELCQFAQLYGQPLSFFIPDGLGEHEARPESRAKRSR